MNSILKKTNFLLKKQENHNKKKSEIRKAIEMNHKK